MAEETLFTISVDAFGDGPDRSNPKEPPVDTNISNPTPKNHTRGYTLENTFENASGDPVKQFVVQNFEQINAMYSTFLSKRKEINPTSIIKNDDHPILEPWESNSGGQPEEAIQQTPGDATLAGKDQVDWKKKIAETKAINEVLMTNEKWSLPCHESRTSQPSISIAFSSNDPIQEHCNGDNQLIIKADIKGCMIHRIYVDKGSSTKIMYEHCFQQLSNEEKASIRSLTSPLVGFCRPANPEKVKAVVDMISPRAIREVQSLNGKLAALGRFLAKSAEKVLMFFKMLKGCIDRKEF
ncbi:hypothetical protein Tco_1313964 [Tanacetum coccineum]